MNTSTPTARPNPKAPECAGVALDPASYWVVHPTDLAKYFSCQPPRVFLSSA